MVEFSSVIVPLSVALALALVVERFLEISKHIMDLFLGMGGTRKIPHPSSVTWAVDDLEAKANEGQARVKDEEIAEQANIRREQLLAIHNNDDPTPVEVKKELAETEHVTEFDEDFDNATVLALPAKDPDVGKAMQAFVLQLLGFAAGILLAHFCEVQLFHALLADQAHLISSSTDYLLTGLLIGGGSKPVHLIIRFITHRKTVAREEHHFAEEEQAKSKVGDSPQEKTAVVPVKDNHEWIDIEYHGGVDREKIESVHKRLKDPTMIIYHHTAMHSDSHFEDVVRVIKHKKWVTGYNCVVMANGTIKPFCRWDRFGNHAVGYNRKSLGLSFNGNFETNANVPFSNPDGRAGIQRPTQEQLQSSARIIALWCCIYNIPKDFDNTIIPHNKISSKSCPGNNFPYDEFKKWISHYYDTWHKSEFAMARIEEFKLKPYLYT